MSPTLPSRPGRRVWPLVVGLLLALAALAAAPAAGAAPRAGSAPDMAATADRLARALGAQGAGAWLDTSGRLTVNVLGARAAAQVRAAGATPRLVTRGTARLERVKAALDAAGNAPVGASWGVDLASNTVLVSVPAGRGAAFVAGARSFGAAVRVERAPVVHTQALYGGQAIYRGGSRCRLQLPRQRLRRHPGQRPGRARPARRRAPLRRLPRHHRGRPGAGRLLGLQDRVDHGHDLRHRPGLRRHRQLRRRHRVRADPTSICTQPGDSGGALYAGSLAQGITSGGTIGGCQPGFRSFFQPADEALGTYGLTLL
jgi:streptogrisin D